MLFEYSFINSKGEIEKKRLEAVTISDARVKITEEERRVALEVVEVSALKKTKGKDETGDKNKNRAKITRKQLLIFTKHFSMIVNAGIGLRKCFEILEEQEKDKVFKPVVMQLHRDIASGASLTQSFSKYPKIFNKFYLSMLEISEMSGTLKMTLKKVVETIEQDIKRKSQIKSALVYPSIIIVVAILVLVFMLVVIIPKFMVMFQGTGVEMPYLTQKVIDLSDLLRNDWYVFIIGGILGIIILKQLVKTEAIKAKLDKQLLRLPIFGKFINYIVVSQILRNLSTLLAAGVTFSNTFEIVNKSIQNSHFKKVMSIAEKSITEGNSIALSFEDTKSFPIIVTNMIKIGEDSGKLIEALNNSFAYIEEEVDAVIKALLTALEPIIILFVSIGVGILVIAMYLPLFKMSEMAG